jgi:nucleotide-binding universal stress UspA family protein
MREWDEGLDWMLARPGGVLVGTDGSATANKTVEAAARMALAYGQDLVIATGLCPHSRGLSADPHRVPEDQRWQVTPGCVGEEIVDRAIRRARVIVDDQVRVHGRFEVGNPARILLRLAREIDPMVVVVGNIGLEGWGRRFSVPYRVARGARTAVVMVDTASWARGGVFRDPDMPLTLRRCA